MAYHVVPGDSTVSVYDVARANLLVLEDARADYRAFNVGGRRKVSVLAYAELITQRIAVAIEPRVPGVYRLGDTRHVFSDVSKLEALGWEPTVPLVNIVDDYIAWAQEQPDLADYYSETELTMKRAGVLRRVDLHRRT